MTALMTRQAKLDELKQIEECLVLQPEAGTFYLERARLMSELGMNEEAKEAYLKILAKDPMNFIAMNNLGTLLFSMGFRSAARTAYEAVTQRWTHAVAHVNLANMLREDGDLENARIHYETALRLTANERCKAHQGLAYIMAEQGNEEAAEYHRHEGFKDQPVVILPFKGKDEPVTVLVVMSAKGGNIPTHPFLDDKTFQIILLVAEFFDISKPLPDHQIFFNAIGDVELCGEALSAAMKIVEKTTAPIINHPAQILPTSRAGNAARLQHIPGLVTPKIITLPRADVRLDVLEAHGFTFPVLLRRPGYHGGAFFEKADHAVELRIKLDEMQGDEVNIIQYVDYRSADGKIRKYRAMLVAGEIFPLHLAISEDKWKLHYFSADMAENAEHRAEDAAFLNDMPNNIGPRAMNALKEVQKTLDLDYAGIDFGINKDGDVVFFEANATMVIAIPTDDHKWDFRREPVRRIQNAAHQMILNKLPSAQKQARSA